MTAEPEAREQSAFPRGIVREGTPLSLWGGDTLVYRVVAVLAGATLPVVIVAHWLLRGEMPWPQAAFIAANLAGAIGCLGLASRGRREIAGVILVGTMWLATTIYAFTTGYGMHSALVTVYVPCLIYSALFFGFGFAAGQFALTVAALGVMYWAEATGRIDGVAGVLATGTGFNYFLGLAATLAATLIGGLTYHRRVEREASRVMGEAATHLAALKAAQEARAQVETANAQLAAAGVALDAHAVRRDREHERQRRTLELLRHGSRGELAELAELTLRPLLPEALDITALAQEAAARARAAGASACVFVRIDPGLRARGDRRMVGALLDRLVERACRACREEAEPTVHVGGGSLEGQQVFFIRDNGPALDPQRRAALFEPYRHGGGEPDLSAVIARCVAERHGGELDADFGRGNETTFFFSLAG